MQYPFSQVERVMYTMKPVISTCKFLFLCDKDGNIIGIVPATAA